MERRLGRRSGRAGGVNESAGRCGPGAYFLTPELSGMGVYSESAGSEYRLMRKYWYYSSMDIAARMDSTSGSIRRIRWLYAVLAVFILLCVSGIVFFFYLDPIVVSVRSADPIGTADPFRILSMVYSIDPVAGSLPVLALMGTMLGILACVCLVSRYRARRREIRELSRVLVQRGRVSLQPSR